MTVSQQTDLMADDGPVRAIGRGRRSVRGRSIVNGQSVSFESSLEHDFLELLKFDRGEPIVTEQPVRISYDDKLGRKRSYIPDFRALYRHAGSSGQKGLLFEVKYRVDLWATWPTLKPKFLAARRYAREHSFRFVIMTEVEIRGAYLQNIKLLNQYRNIDPNGAIEEKLSATLAILGETTPRALLSAAYNVQQSRVAAVAYLMRLISLNRIHADLSRPLDMNSTIWITAGEGFQCDPHSFHPYQV